MECKRCLQAEQEEIEMRVEKIEFDLSIYYSLWQYLGDEENENQVKITANQIE